MSKDIQVKKVKKPVSFFADTSVKKIDFDNGQWLEIRNALTYKELVETHQDGMTKFDAAIALLKKCIVNWHLLDNEGNPVVFTEEALASLSPKAALFLQQECSAALGILEDEEEEKKE